MRTKTLQAICFLATHVLIAALLLWLSYVGVNHIPFGTFGRASVGDAMSRMVLFALFSPIIMIVAGYLNAMLLKFLHWIDFANAFWWRLPLFCISAILLVWVINYASNGAIGWFLLTKGGFEASFAAPAFICLIASLCAMAVSIRLQPSR
jgi:hypothetical protein